ncbi:MAG: hypothetical protein ABIE75_05200, partial [Candidatus Omnitrophota bacterium]
MDNIALIGHMSGEGQAVVDKLRKAGFTTLNQIIKEKPAALAVKTGLKSNIVAKIKTSAKALAKTRPTPKTKVRPKKKEAKVRGSEKAKTGSKRKKTESKKKIARKTPGKPIETTKARLSL